MRFLRSFILALALCALCSPFVAGQSLRDSLQPSPLENGFSMPGYYLWCPSVIKVGDTYHMFATRWPAQYGMGGWTSYSECVRATSKNLLGPYKFEEVVLQKRSKEHWDNARISNVRIVRVADTYVLYYTGAAEQTGYAWSKSIIGPWTRCESPVMKGGDPAILVRPDNSIYVMARSKDNRIIAFTAQTFDAPYKPVSSDKNLFPSDTQLGEPCIWGTGRRINILISDLNGRVADIRNAVMQYYSKDGLKYTLVNGERVFTKQIQYDDGTTETFARRECPFVYVNEKGEAIALFTGAFPEKKGEARILAQPIKPYTP